MTLSFRTRLVLLLLAIASLTAGVAYLAHQTWTEAIAVREHFRNVQRESARLADDVRSSLQSLDTDLLRFKLSRDPAQWKEFQKDAAELEQWLEQQRAGPRTEEERAVFDSITSELSSYLQAARHFVGGGTSGTPTPTTEVDDAMFSDLVQRSESLLALGFDLAEAHSASLDSTLARADRAVGRIEWTTFVVLAMLVTAGSATGWLVYRDFISPLQRTLQESRRQLEQQEKLAALGVLSAGIAHEIRNPLTAVKARVFTLRKAVQDDPSATEDVAVINGEVDRLERIVRSFLRFARPPEPQLAPVDPVALLRQVRDLVGPQWISAGIRLELDETPAPAMHADPDLIEQALINMIQNAADAMPQGGVVRLRAFEPVGRSPRTIQLEVADNGPGIPPEVQRRMFDPFFTTKSAGTGLGLSLTARILEKHGGTIHFSTEAGRGTTFVLRIPAAPAPAA